MCTIHTIRWMQVTSWENPCDFFLPFCRWLEMELKEAEQPSEVLNQILGFEKPVQTCSKCD